MFANLLDAILEFWGQRRWPVKLLIAAGLLATLGYFLATPAYHRFADWRCDRNMALAAEALAAGNPAEARNRAYSALLRRPKDIQCIRLTFRAMNQLGDLRRGDMARCLLHHEQATPDDLLAAWPVVARLFPMAIVAYDWRCLGEDHRKTPAFFLPLADRLVEEHRYDDAVKLFKPIDLDKPTPTGIEKRVLEILVSRGKPAGIPEAQNRLTERIDRQAPDIAELLPMLEPVPMEKLDPELGDALVQWLSRQKNPAPSESLAVARFRIAMAGKKPVAEAIVETNIETWKDTAPAPLARWLLAVRRPESALRILPAGQPDNADFYRLRRDSLAALDQWKNLLEMLAAYKIPPKGVPKLEWHLDLIRTAKHLGDISLQSEQWAAAMTEAKIIPLTGFLALARMAENRGLKPESEEALLEAIRTARGPLPFYSNLYPLIDSLYRQGKAEDMLNLATIYLPIEPGNPAVLIHYTYLKTILGQADEDLTAKILGPLFEKHPENSALLRIFALQDLVAGRFANAAKALRPVASPPAESNPVTRILYGIALLGSGKLDEGLAVTESVDWQPLMPAETTLLDQLLASAREKLDPGAKAKTETIAMKLASARKKARAETEKRAKIHAEARQRARTEAEKHSRAMLETREKALQKKKPKSSANPPR